MNYFSNFVLPKDSLVFYCDFTVMNPRSKENLKPFKHGFDERRNISGRPPSLEEILLEAVTREDQIECFKVQVEKAKKGDLRATEFIFGYAHGRPHQSTDLTTNGKDLITQNIIVPDKETANAMEKLKRQLNEGNNSI